MKMKVAVSWSGGMESSLALYKALKEGYDVAYLVAFATETWPQYTHPLPVMALQSKSIGIPLLKREVKDPFEKTYREAISGLIDNEGIEGIVTGDIYVVDELHGRWMDKVTEGLDISLIMPLWEQDTSKVLNEEVTTGFRSIFTSILQEWLSEEWLGRELNQNSAKELQALADKTGLDPCGEKGEYHTMTIDGPIFKQAIEFSKVSKEKKDNRLYLKIDECSLKPKQ
jgi:diphthine-ammonia ligase